MINDQSKKRARTRRKPLGARTCNRPPRRWQKKARRHYFAVNKRRYLITGTPGSGKSRAAIEIGRDLYEQGKIDRIVVVVPTEELKIQWAREFAKVGVDLDPYFSNSSGVEADDFHGVIVTYQQVSAEPILYDLNCETKTLVIFDEIHHAADGADWGNKLNLAFARAARILCLSGTPFRHDNLPIPFVGYDKRGRSVADFSYSYPEALADGVCRPVVFPLFEAEASWIDGRGRLRSQTEFAELSKEKAAELLRAVLNPKGDWLRTVLRQADAKLSEYRTAGHRDAAGLVIAVDQEHAKSLAKLLRAVTGETPVIVISEDSEATKALADFKRSGTTTRWIVAVRMVSEGIDIPRLRVGVFATNITSELFFRQAVGRFVRVIPNLGEQEASFYLPAHPILSRHALAIKEERDHVLPHISRRYAGAAPTADQSGKSQSGDVRPPVEVADDTFDEHHCGEENGASAGDDFNHPHNRQAPALPTNPGEIGRGDQPGYTRQTIITIKSEARYCETIFDGQRFSDAELRAAERHGKSCGLTASPEQLAAFLRAAAAGGLSENGDAQSPPNNGSSPDSPISGSPAGAGVNNRAAPVDSSSGAPAGCQDDEAEVKTLSERKLELREVINRTTNVLANRRNVKPGIVHGYWTHVLRQSPNAKATLAELQHKLAWLTAQLAETDDFSVDYNAGLAP